MKKSKFQKKCLVYGLVLTFGAGAIGCGGMTRHKWQTKDKIALGAVIVATAADIATTVHILDNGGREMNPIYGDDPSTATIIVSQAIITGLIIWAAQYMTSDERMILWVPAMFRGVAAGHNYREINQ